MLTSRRFHGWKPRFKPLTGAAVELRGKYTKVPQTLEMANLTFTCLIDVID